MCFEYHYHSCGVHYYRVTRILPDLCRCPRETKIVDQDEPCDTCDPPHPESPYSIFKKNARSLTPEGSYVVPAEEDQPISADDTHSTPWVLDVRGKLKDTRKPNEPVQEAPKKKKSLFSKARSLFSGPSYPENARQTNEYPVCIRANMRPDEDDGNDTRWDTNRDGQPGPFDEHEEDYNAAGNSAGPSRSRWNDFY
ncbi:hypothetical protein ABW21_db0202639 [Orbilia brochopaga]|nr:hypothetical protein ABW21_db0202639 [Drechslerella brochopaga]